MKRWLHLGLWLCLAATVAAQENRKVLKVYDWKHLSEQFPNSQVVSMGGMSVLKIEYTNGYWTNITLFTVTNAAIIGKTPEIVCELKTEHPTNLLFSRLELKYCYPPLAVGGDEVTNHSLHDLPMTQFNWSRFEFKVVRSPSYGLPTQFELQLGFSGNGTLYLRPITLWEPAKTFSSWWSPEQSGLIGGIGGSLIGCLGGVIGLLVSKGKSRNFVLAAVNCFIVLGILLTIAGLVAALLKQPYAVWYALLLPGVILILVFSLNLHSIQRRYDELEIRRMTSIDTTGS